MARITAAFGSSHSTMLFSSAAHWVEGFDHIDRKAPTPDVDGVPRSFDWLVEHRPADAVARIAPDLQVERHARTMAALDRLEADIAATEMDALVIVGDDQHEIFTEDSRPAIGIYYGETIRNAAAPAEAPDDWYRRDQNCRLEEGGEDMHYPVRADLAEHLIRGLTADGFDITAIKALAPDRYEGHAYSFVHRRLLKNSPVPIVPVFLNTYYPPNQPAPQRCRALGNSLRDLIARFPAELEIGLFASGGLSHFLVNEELDGIVVDALRSGNLAPLLSVPLCQLESGASEIRSWIAVAAAARDLALDWIDYVPAYRSQALTGVGLGFAHWK